jgi:VanZ family protein
MKRLGLFLDTMILLGLLLGLFYSSSQPYYKQDLRGTISRYVDADFLEQKWQHVSFQYAHKEISVEDSGAAGLIEFFIRKATHFVTFAVLAFMFYRLLARFTAYSTALPWSGFLSVLTALLDEWHQTFTPDRTGMLTDVLLDTTGIVTMMILIVFRRILRRGPRKKRDKIRLGQPS